MPGAHSQKPDLSREIFASQDRSLCGSRRPVGEQLDVWRQKQSVSAYERSAADAPADMGPQRFVLSRPTVVTDHD